MRTFTQYIPAESSVDFSGGIYFLLMECPFTVDVSIFRNNTEISRATSVQGNYYTKFEEPFDQVRVFSRLAQTITVGVNYEGTGSYDKHSDILSGSPASSGNSFSTFNATQQGVFPVLYPISSGVITGMFIDIAPYDSNSIPGPNPFTLEFYLNTLLDPISPLPFPFNATSQGVYTYTLEKPGRTYHRAGYNFPVRFEDIDNLYVYIPAAFVAFNVTTEYAYI